MGSSDWPTISASTSDFTGYTTSHPPGVSDGTLSQLRHEGQQWLGPRLSHDTPAEDRVTREKTAAGPRGIVLPWFLPYVDNYTQETSAMRVAYRQMLADPNVKSALLGKLLAVAALDLKVQPYRKGDDEAKGIADFVHWNLTERLTDGVPGLIWSILSGGLIDGYSVCEKVWGYEEKGPHAGKIVLKDVKPKDTLNDVVLLTDPFRNVVGVQGLRYNAGQIFPPSDFILWRHLPLFGSPVGTSDFRAAYSRYWMLDTVLKIRAMGLEKRSLPVLLGHYSDPALQPTLADALAKAKSQTWITVPDGAKVEALNIAGMADAQFGEAIKDLKHDIFLGIQGAILQALEGETKEGAGNSQVHRSTADLWVWFLSQTVQATLNNRDNGLVRDMVDLNYVTPDYPKSTLSAVDSNELVQEMQIDTGLKGLGLDLSKEEAYERYSRSAPKDDADALKGTQPPAPPGAPPPAGGGIADNLPFNEFDDAEQFEDGEYHGPTPPGPGWVQSGVGAHGGKIWKRAATGDKPAESDPEQSTPKGILAKASSIASKAASSIKGAFAKLWTAIDEEHNAGPSAIVQGVKNLSPSTIAHGISRTITSVFQCVHEEVFENVMADHSFGGAHAVGVVASKALATGEKLLLKGISAAFKKLGLTKQAEAFADAADLFADPDNPVAKHVLDLAVSECMKALKGVYAAAGVKLPLPDAGKLRGRLLRHLHNEPEATEHAEGEYHGPEAPGPGWVQAGTGPKGGKIWKQGGISTSTPSKPPASVSDWMVDGTFSPEELEDMVKDHPGSADGLKAAADWLRAKKSGKADAPTEEPAGKGAFDATAVPKLVDAFEFTQDRKASANQLGGDGTAYLPELHYRIKKVTGQDLPPEQFQKLMGHLRDSGAVELHILNEVRMMPERDKDLVVRRQSSNDTGEQTYAFAIIKDKKKLADELGKVASGKLDLSTAKHDEYAEGEYHGPTAPDDTWVQVGVGPKGGKVWRQKKSARPKNAAPAPTATSSPPEHQAAVVAAFKALDKSGDNLVSLADLRDHLAAHGLTDRGQQDAAIHELLKADRMRPSGLEGRHALKDPERHKREVAASITEGENKIGYLSLRKFDEEESANAEPFREATSETSWGHWLSSRNRTSP